MAFPINPTDGQTTVVNGITYTYSTAQTAWDVSSSGGALTVATEISAQGNIIGSTIYANSFTTVGNIDGGNLFLTGILESGPQNVTGDVYVAGNVNVDGNLNYQNVQDLVVGDPLIYIGANNTGNIYDLGFTVTWTDAYAQYGGLVRDATDGTWKLFGNVTTAPTTTVNFANAIYQPLLTGPVSSTGTVTSTGLQASGAVSASGNITGNNVLTSSVTASGNVSASGLTVGSGVVTTTLTAGTVLNTRINPRTVSTSSGAGITINSDITDQFNITALSQNTVIQAPTGTPVDGQKLTIRIIDNGSSQTLGWDVIFVPIGSTLPIATVPNKYLYVGCIYNATTVAWDVVSIAQQS